MSKVFITSDLHLGHDRSFIYEPRGFKSIEEHDEEIIKRWNSVIDAGTEVYCLGDLMLGNNNHGLECIKKLNGNIHVIRGNHDTDTRMKLYGTCPNIVEIVEGKFLKYKKYHFYLSHFPCLTSNYLDSNKFLKNRMLNLHGHTHFKEKFNINYPYCYNCCVDAHNIYPVRIDQIIEDFLNYHHNSQG